MSKVAVVGAGTMGNGIAHVFAQHGWDVTLIDVSDDALARGLTTIKKNLEPNQCACFEAAMHVMELDWSVGQVMKSLKENGLEDNTLVLMTSDNGPWTSYGNHAGHTPFREAKGTSFDGGTRSACITEGISSRCDPDRIERPTTCTPSSNADLAICDGVRRIPS